jgi:hypothetical protein
MGMFLFYVVVSAIWGTIAAHVDRASGGSAARGFAWGAVLGLIGLGVVFYRAHRRNARAAAGAI